MGQHEKAIKNPRGVQTSLPAVHPPPSQGAQRSLPEAPKNDWQSTTPFISSNSGFAATELNSVLPYSVENPLETDPLPELTLGAWVELNYPEGHLQRAELTWISPHGTMYLFKNGDGQTTSLSKSMCQRLFQQQGLRVIAMNSMVDDALDTVMAQAVRNSAIWP
jgi:hypothetical protein